MQKSGALRCDIAAVVALVVGLLAPSATSQLGEQRGERSSPFRRGAETNDVQSSRISNVSPSTIVKLPKAVQVSRPLNLMPPKANLVAPKEDKVQAVLGDFDRHRTDLVQQIVDARSRKDDGAVTRLVIDLDRLRQRRLQFLRPVAERVVPAQPSVPSLDQIEGPKGAESRPVLPIPTLPPKKN